MGIDAANPSGTNHDPLGADGEGLLWAPSPGRAATTRLAEFTARVLPGAEYAELHRWSVENPDAFWEALADSCGLVGERAPDRSDWMLNYAANLLDGRGQADADIALIERNETGYRRVWTFAQLREAVARCQVGLRRLGVGRGDVVAAWMPNTAATIVTMLAANGLGAVFTSTSPDFGVDGVLDRFGQVQPRVLVATDGYSYNGRWFDCITRLGEIAAGLGSVATVVVRYPRADEADSTREPASLPAGTLSWEDLLAESSADGPHFEQVPFDHPGFILFSSGTTGPPKCIEHRAGGVLITHLREHALHCDIRAGDRVFWFTTCGWMMWNWLVSALAQGASVVLFDGSPSHPGIDTLWALCAQEQISHFGVPAKYLDAVTNSGYRPIEHHDLSSVRMIGSTGSPLSPERFRWVYADVATDVHLASISGGTDLCGIFIGGVPTRPVYAGEIQGPALGMDVAAVDEAGSEVMDQPGELVCRNRFPSEPLRFVGDDGTRLRAAYYDRFPGWWHHGDFVTHTGRDGFVVHGRSDTTLNPGGVRIGTAEIYRQVEHIDGIEESLVFGQPHDGDVRIVLLVRLAEGLDLDDGLRAEIRQRIRAELTPRHVPAVIAQVADLPRTRSNKLVELAVADIVAGRPVRNTEAIANPEALAAIAALEELRSDG